MTCPPSKYVSSVYALSRIAELNPNPVLRRRKMGTKERKRGRRGEAPLPVGGVKREECSRHPLRDHTTVVHKVGKTQTCREFCFADYLTCRQVRKRCSSIFFCFSGSQERKLQRRSVRSRSESERGSDPVPKKKTKKEQVSVLSR